MKNLTWAFVCALLVLAAGFPAHAGSLDFTFESQSTGTSTISPFNETVGGVTATFSSPAQFLGPHYFVTDDTGTGLTLTSHLFSGHYLAPAQNDIAYVLDILFSAPISSISLTFATQELTNPSETPNNIQLTAFVDSTSGAPLGSQTAAAALWQEILYPIGTLTYNPGGASFNLVEISIPRPSNAAAFYLDNITVETSVPEPGTLGFLGLGMALLALRLPRYCRR